MPLHGIHTWNLDVLRSIRVVNGITELRYLREGKRQVSNNNKLDQVFYPFFLVEKRLSPILQ
jgi:hypothetical protein